MAEQFVGRRAEEQAVTDFLDFVPRQSSALVIEGEAGIGKTTLWLDTLGQARTRTRFRLRCRRRVPTNGGHGGNGGNAKLIGNGGNGGNDGTGFTNGTGGAGGGRRVVVRHPRHHG